MTRHIVCLSFDFDAISGWIARGVVTPTSVSRGEFAVVGARRVLDFLKLRGLASTWFIPGHTIHTYPEVCARVVANGHEVGHHGYVHEPPGPLDHDQEEAILVRGNDAIRALTGRTARGYRSPSWDLSANSVELLLKHGFLYDSSMMADDYQPYRARTGDVIPPDAPPSFGARTRLIELPISWSLDDLPHFEYVRYPNRLLATMQRTSHVLENWLDEFEYMKRTTEWGVLTYTFHPEVIGRGYRMMMFEKLVESLADRGAVFMTMEQAALEYDSLRPFAQDGGHA